MTAHTKTDHVSPETARKLADLGAFEGRELKVGDWVADEQCEHELVVQNHRDCLYSCFDPNTNIVFPFFYVSSGAMASESDIFFLPRLADLLDELERVCSTNTHLAQPEIIHGVGDRCRCAVFDNQHARGFVSGKGRRYEEAAANCLLAVLEGRKQG